MFVYRVQKYLGAYLATLGGQVDAVVFSAGIGENSSIIRDLILGPIRVGEGPCRPPLWEGTVQAVDAVARAVWNAGLWRASRRF